MIIADMIDRAIMQIQKFRLRDYIMLVILILLIFPVWVAYKVLENPEKLSLIMDLNERYKFTGTVGNCLLYSAKNRTQPSYKLIKESPTSTDALHFGQYAEQSVPFDKNEARVICGLLTNNEQKFVNIVVETKIKALPAKTVKPVK